MRNLLPGQFSLSVYDQFGERVLAQMAYDTRGMVSRLYLYTDGRFAGEDKGKNNPFLYGNF